MLLVENFWSAKNFVLVMWCGTFPARAALAGVRLPPTLEADKPAFNALCSLVNELVQDGSKTQNTYTHGYDHLEPLLFLPCDLGVI